MYPKEIKHIKVKLVLDIHKPLKLGMYTTCIDIRYERILMFFYSCGIIGHNKDYCKK